MSATRIEDLLRLVAPDHIVNELSRAIDLIAIGHTVAHRMKISTSISWTFMAPAINNMSLIDDTAFEAHCVELCQRVLNGEDLTVPTEVEIDLIICNSAAVATAKHPVTHEATAAYGLSFRRLFPDSGVWDDGPNDLDAYVAALGTPIETLVDELRAAAAKVRLER